MISEHLKKLFFTLICSRCSPDFYAYLHAYQGLSTPPYESLEVSCELINGIKADRMRMAILGLRRQDVLGWISACGRKIPLIQDILFENTTEACFGIGLVDFSYGSGISRTKIFNEYGLLPSQAQISTHVRRLFSIFNMPDVEFEKDLKLYKTVKLSAIDWNLQGQASLKVYYGPFKPRQMYKDFPEVLLKDSSLSYDNLRQKDILPEAFEICARYGLEGRSLKANLRCRASRTVPYLKMFDYKREASKFFVDFYRVIPALKLVYVCKEWDPVEKTQFYFKVF